MSLPFLFTFGKKKLMHFIYSATRRRHGIPDDDLRPFNVAYTDAVMRAREEELKRQVKPSSSMPIRSPLAPLPNTPAGAASSAMHGEAVTGHAGYHQYYNQHTLRQRSGKQGICIA